MHRWGMVAAFAIVATAGCAAERVTTPAPRPADPAAERITAALGGRAPGVQVSSSGGVRISLHEDWPPPGRMPNVFVVDGVAMTGAEMQALAIRPEDIVDIRVMKADAALQAYGERGANGAVVIRLKH